MFDFFAHHEVIEGDYDLKDIQVEEELGRGNSHVYVAKVRGMTMALKQMEIKTDAEYDSFLKEITFMQKVSQWSQWIVKYEGYLVTKMQRNLYERSKYAFLLMECAQLNLEQYLSVLRIKSIRMRGHQLINCMQQILQALAQLEDNNVAHCDIKPENILIMDSTVLTIKLCDVGSSKVVEQSSEQATILGTVPFLAPQLLKSGGKKIVSANPFKSDMFSFGLVLLYMITLKKLKTHQRIQINAATYEQVIKQWIKQAKQITNNDPIICQVLKLALDFDQRRRPMFKQVHGVFINQSNKKSTYLQYIRQKILKQDEQRLYKMGESSCSINLPANNCISLFKSSGRFDKTAVVKTTTTGNAFKIGKATNYSPMSANKCVDGMSSQSPHKKSWSFADDNKVIYITDQTHQSIQEITQQQDKKFVLAIPLIKFKRAESITILPSCSLQVFTKLQGVQCKKLFLECSDVDAIGLPEDTPVFNFVRIKANLTKCRLEGGFDKLFRCFAGDNLETLEVRLTESQATFKQLIYLLDQLQSQCPKLNCLLIAWQKQILNEQEHSQLTERIAKLPLRKLTMLMNQNYIKYEQAMRWQLPRQCQVIYLDYAHNLVNNVLSNLSISLAKSNTLKQLYLNFQNNNLQKGQIHMLMKAITSIRTLQKLVLNLSYNKLQDLKYLQTVLLQLLSISSLQIKLHRTDIPLPNIINFIVCIKQLFQFNLKILRISCNRTMLKKQFIDLINAECLSKNASKYIFCDVVGFDNQFFMLYLKKKEKTQQTSRRKASISTRKKEEPRNKDILPKLATTNSIHQNFSAIPYATTFYSTHFSSNSNIFSYYNPNLNNNSAGYTSISPKINQQSNPRSGVCLQLYTSSDNFNNYLCLGCSQTKQMSKYTYFCKYCITSCMHKDHNIVKLNARTCCSCAFSGYCRSDIRQLPCAELMGVTFKKEFRCDYCDMSYCAACIEPCSSAHREYIQQRNQLSYFKCKAK